MAAGNDSSASEASFEVLEIDLDPVVQFLNQLDLQLGDLGPMMRDTNTGRNTLIETAKSGKFNFDMISNAISKLESMGHAESAMQISKKAKKTLEHSCEELLALRTHTAKIASYFVELGGHIREGDTELAKEALDDVVDASDTIAKKSLMVKAEYSTQEEELLAECKEFQNQEKSYRADEQLYKVEAAVTGLSSVAIVVATPFAAATSVGGVVVAVCPFTLAAGLVGVGIFGTCSYIAKQMAEESGVQAGSAKDVADMTRCISEAADANRTLWCGISMASSDLKDAVDTVKNLNPRRKSQFDTRMQELAKSLSIFVEALDEYLVWLSLCKYFPANYPIERKVGVKRFQIIRQGLMDEKVIGRVELI